jgi:glucose/mannose-6-phosphate isomerase
MPLFQKFQLNNSRYTLENKYQLCQKSILGFVPQAIYSWQKTSEIKLSKKYQKAKSIIFGGMGGSSLPSRLVSSAYNLTVPYSFAEDYKLPMWANEHTLVVLSSYSGNTEEVISLANDALKKKCMIFGITSGGLLEEFMIKNSLPHFVFETHDNPSMQPRFGTGYIMFSILGILASQGYVADYSVLKVQKEIKKTFKDLNNVLDEIYSLAKNLSNGNHTVYNFISCEFLVANARLASAQFNESSKILSFHSEIPEGCHNLIEGYTNDSFDTKTIFLESNQFHPQNQKRLELLQDIIKSHSLDHGSFRSVSSSILGQIVENIFFSSFLSLELAKKRKNDPISIPNVEKLKRSL